MLNRFDYKSEVDERSYSRKKYEMGHAFSFAIVLTLIGCLNYSPNESPVPLIAIPTTYSLKGSTNNSDDTLHLPWWNAYENGDLSSAITEALNSNFSLQSAWNRLEQSQAQYRVLFADRYPSINLQGGASRTRSKYEVAQSDPNLATSTHQVLNNISAGATLSYEVDLWGRIGAQVASGKAVVESSRADVENTALILSGRVAELWIRAQEQQALLKLLNEQIQLGSKLLELTQMRFKVGHGSLVDVYQQSQQLNATRSELPIAESTFEQTLNQLAVLEGRLPNSLKATDFSGHLPPLPKFPEMATPVTLLESRPDLRQVREQLIGAEYDIEAGIANRLPLLSVGLSENINATSLANIFANEIDQLLSSVTIPLFEGGRRIAEVDRRRARVQEIKNQYTGAFLIALQDVENAIIAERSQQSLIKVLEAQVADARATLEESRHRYLKGIGDYLQVVLAVQTVQGLERRIVSEHRELLLARNRLYLALGGAWTKNLTQNVEKLS